MVRAEEIERIVLENYPDVSTADIAKCLHYEWETIRKQFYQYYGISANTFIRRVILSQTYRIWVDGGAPRINKKAKFAQIKNFRTKFIREFGFDIYYAHDNNFDMRERTLNMTDPIEELNEAIRFGMIRNYKVEEGKVILDINQEMILALLLEFGTLLYKKDLFQTDWYKKMPFKTKCIFLLTLVKGEPMSLKNPQNKLEVNMSEEEILKALEMFKQYNIESPDIYGDYVVFHPVIPESFEELFYKTVNKLIGNIYFPFKDATVDFNNSFELAKILAAVKYTSPISNINQLAKNSHMSNAKVKTILWKFTRAGLIRFANASDIIRNGNE